MGNKVRARRRIGAMLLGTAALAVLGNTMPAAAASYVDTEGALEDFQPATEQPTDGAEARLVAFPVGGSTRFFLFVTGLDPEAAGTTLGAHIHVGPCVAGNGAAAGPHYNTTGKTTPADTDHEVWLDFTIRPGGVAFSRTTVPFVIDPGEAQSLVIHALETQPGTGLAGPRWACLPVEF